MIHVHRVGQDIALHLIEDRFKFHALLRHGFAQRLQQYRRVGFRSDALSWQGGQMVHQPIYHAISDLAHTVRRKFQLRIHASGSKTWRMACSNSSFERAVLINSSWRAPALNAMAFHPLVTGTVTRIFTFPFASRTGRITPGITDRISRLSRTKRSSTSRTPSIMLCSTLSLPCSLRSLN